MSQLLMQEHSSLMLTLYEVKRKMKRLFSFHSMVSTVEKLHSVKKKTLPIHKYIFCHVWSLIKKTRLGVDQTRANDDHIGFSKNAL